MSQVSGGVKACMYFPNFPTTLLGSAKAELLNSVPCSAETLWFIFPTVWCQTLSDPNDGREKKLKKNLGEQIKPQTIYYTQQSTYLIE